jgi:hypothetical protein
MRLQLRRIIPFTPNLDATTAFYSEALGLKVAGREKVGSILTPAPAGLRCTPVQAKSANARAQADFLCP